MAKSKWTIWTHIWAHLDELFALWMLFVYGESKFAGISDAEVELLDIADPVFLKTSADDLLKRMIICLGVGQGGLFNEHAKAGETRKGNECASTLVAKYLGIDKYPELQKMLEAVKGNDLDNKNNDLLSLSKSLLLRWESGMSAQKVLEWAFEEISLRVNEQARIWSDESLKIASTAQIATVVTDRGRDIVVAVIKTDDDKAVTRMSIEESPDVTVRFNSKGHVAILVRPSTKLGIFLDSVVYRLRMQEAAKRGLRIDPCQATKAESLFGWHAHKGKAGRTVNVFNGGVRAQLVPPTQLTAKEVVLAVIQGLKEAN